MAAYFLQVKPVFQKFQQNFFNKTKGFVRNKSVILRPFDVDLPERGHFRNSAFEKKRKSLSVARTGQVLKTQTKLAVNPGLNVGIGKVARLYAKAPGKVVISYEKTNYKVDAYIVQKSFPNYIPLYAKYINVIPEPLHRRFKLVEKFYMATQLPVSKRTQGDGMEKVENECPREEIVVLQPQEIKEMTVENDLIEKMQISKTVTKNFDVAVKLTPQTVSKSKKDILSSLKNKEPKFVPYEPYKAAVRPIVPQNKKSIFKTGLKKKKNPVSIFSSSKGLSEIKESEVEKTKDSFDVTEVDWKGKYKGLESELQMLREENKELENQLKFQVQVNGELKNLLVAAVGEDMETKVHVLTEDKLHLAQALLKSAESLTTHQEQTEWLAGQCEVWRSKFLASSVMVEELARWKASLSQKVNEAHEALKKLLEDGKQIRGDMIETHRNLSLLRDNFDLHSKKNNMKDCSIIDVSAENLKMTEVLLLELLGSEKKLTNSHISHLKNLKETPAEKSAEHVLSNPNILQLIGEPDAACNAVVGVAVNLNGQLYLQNHPPKIECCPQCSGEIKLV